VCEQNGLSTLFPSLFIIVVIRMSDDVLAKIPDAFQEVDGAVLYVKYAMIGSAAAFVVSFPFCYRQGSFFGLASARRVIALIRLCVVVEVLLMMPLLYCVITVGAPLKLHAYTVYDSKGNSWLYGWGRPIVGLVFVGIGLIADMHMYPRVLCMLGCIHQVVMDGLSEFQVHNYYKQGVHRNAPTGKYTAEMLHLYYWRDLVSIGIGLLLILYLSYFSSIVGWGLRQRISYASIVGGDLDRCATMRQQREIRRRVQNREEFKDIEADTKAALRMYRQKEEEYEAARNRNLDVDHMETLQREVGGGKDMYAEHAP
jgi:hypothetical protein